MNVCRNAASNLGRHFSLSVTSVSSLWWIVTCIYLFWSMHPEYLPLNNFYDHKKILQLLWLAVTSLLLLDPNVRKDCSRIVASLEVIPLLCALLLVVFGCLSVVKADNFWIAFREYLNLLFFICLIPVIVSMSMVEKKRLGIYIYFIFFSCLIYVFKYSVALVAAIVAGDLISPKNLVSGVLNINFAAQFLVFFVPVIALQVEFSESIRAKALWMIVGLIFWLMIFIQDYRGVFVAVAFCFCAIFFSNPMQFKRLLVNQLSLLLGAFLLFILITYLCDVPSLDGQIEHLVNPKGRVEMWLECLELLLKDPLQGVGPYHFVYYTQLPFSHPHNFYMQVLGEWGIVSAFCVFFLLYRYVSSGFFAVRDRFKSTPFSKSSMLLPFCYFGSLAGYLLGGVSGVMVMPLPQSLLLLLTGVSISLFYVSKGSNDENSSAVVRPVIKLFSAYYSFVFLFIVVCFFATIFIVQYVLPHDCLINVGPRFWSLGGESRC